MMIRIVGYSSFKMSNIVDNLMSQKCYTNIVKERAADSCLFVWAFPGNREALF